jgi:predicted dehydrogenase
MPGACGPGRPVEVVHAFSPSAARRDAFAARFPFPTCDSLDTILDDDRVEAVAVFTPANTHRDIAWPARGGQARADGKAARHHHRPGRGARRRLPRGRA